MSDSVAVERINVGRVPEKETGSYLGDLGLGNVNSALWNGDPEVTRV